jgi:hypothetical protein
MTSRLAGTEGKGRCYSLCNLLPTWLRDISPNCISHSQNFVSCSRIIKLCVAVSCRPNIVSYSDQSVYKITLKALIQIL